MSIGELLGDRWATIVRIEKKKLEKKGVLNTALGYFLLVGLIWIAQKIGEQYWPENIENQAIFYLVGAFVIHESAQILSFLCYLPGYLNWLPVY